MAARSVSFRNAQGDALAARLELPEGTPRAVALFAHCFTCSKDSKAAAYISQALARHATAVLRFDFTGLGASGGDFSRTSFSSNIADLLCAADFLRREHAAPGLLIGHSLGGAAVLAAAPQISDARAVVTIGSPFEPGHVAHLLKPGTHGQVDIGGRPFELGPQFLEDLERHDPAKTIGSLGKALLVMHSPTDTTVGIDNAAKIFMAAKHPKSFVSLDKADHLLTRAADAGYAADVLAAWASRYF
jgi:putative redox protein